MIDLIRNIADLLDIEVHQIFIVLAAGAVIIAMMLFAWYLYWGWMFSFFGN